METLVQIWNVVFVVMLGFCGSVGLLAMTSSRLFTAVASYGSRTVFQGAATRVDDRRIDIDEFVLAHGRVFGVIVTGLTGYLWMLSQHGPDAYSKSFLLVIVGVALVMGLVALRHIMWQQQKIASHQAEANADPLTGVANRRGFDLDIERGLTQQHCQKTPLSLMMIDIDEFKSFNDDYGHTLGDAILIEMAAVLEATVEHRGTIARFGGDEFAVLLTGSRLAEASEIAEKVRKAIGDEPLTHEGREHTITVSIGVAEAQFDDDARSLLKRADSALYAAKEAGRNCSYRHGSPEPAVMTRCG